VYSVSGTGLLIYQAGLSAASGALAWYSRDGKLLGDVGRLATYARPAISPDGRQVAVNIRKGIDGDIWIFDLVRGTETRLMFDGKSLYPIWSADGKKIIYAGSDQNEHRVLYSKPVDNSGPPQTLIPDIGQTVWFSASADGRYLALMRSSDQPGWAFDIWGVDLQGDRKPFPVVRTPFLEGVPSLSPDGKWLAYTSNENGDSDIYITSFPAGGAKWQVSTGGGTQPHWRGDGKELFFSVTNNRIMAVDVAATANSITLGTPHPLFQANMQGAPLGQFDVTRDGKKFLLNSLNTQGGSSPLTLVTNWPAELRK
jgi:Tol biopolymer transport system component